jgi:hypothetical protein
MSNNQITSNGFSNLNTNQTIDYQELSNSVFIEHNKIRLDPASYIPILEKYVEMFKGDVLYKPKEIPIQTHEGPAAYQEAIEFLKNQQPVHELILDERLKKAAEDHVKDIGPKGLLSHDGTDGRSVSERVEQYCEWNQACGENIDLGSKTGEDVIISLLVDDGVEGRGHRLNLFKPEFKIVGIACGSHREYETISVLVYTGGVRDLGSPHFDYKNFKYQYPADLNSTTTKKKDTTKTKYKSPYQIGDVDAPDSTVSVKITKKSKEYDGKKITVTKKFYTLQDGSQHIVEVEEF